MEYIDEDRILFKNIFEKNYFDKLRQPNNDVNELELFINGICSANCQYCYLKKHQKELFPSQLLDYNTIINNIKEIIKWYIDNKFCCNISLFSAEFLTTKLGIPVLDTIYTGFKDAPFMYRPKIIMIPDNMNFINSDELTAQIQQYIDLFKTININIIFSASIDGAECDFDRTLHDENFYIKCFNFLNKNHFLCHPMVSSNNIKYWKKNYTWWVENAPEYIVQHLMMLEVRDETWTNESINDLIDFCDFLIDFKLKYFFQNNLEEFTDYIFHITTKYAKYSYSPERMVIDTYFNNNNEHTSKCSFSKDFIVRISDLAVILCHRLAYDNLILGYLEKTSNSLELTMNENKVPLALVKAHYKKTCMPCCEKCQFEPICTGYCLGNAYENHKNIIVPIKEVCDMYKCKNVFLIKKYEKLGIFKILKKMPINDNAKQYILDLKDNLNTYI